jgi:hypothetical protein
MIDLREHRRGAAFALIACLAWQAVAALSAAAATMIAIKTNIVEITVDIDDALKSYPGLFDDCVAEGKSFASRVRAGAEKEHREDPRAFRDSTAWTYGRSYALRSAIGRYVSILRSDDTFEGGAHPNHLIDAILWDSQAQKRISIRAFFNETADDGPTMNALAAEAKLAVATLKIARDIPPGNRDKLPANMTAAQYLREDTFINDGIKPALRKIGPLTLAPSTEPGKSSGLTFHYQPYAVGAYVEGAYTAFVPFTAFAKYLSPEGMTLFGGKRPKSDEDKW